MLRAMHRTAIVAGMLLVAALASAEEKKDAARTRMPS